MGAMNFSKKQLSIAVGYIIENFIEIDNLSEKQLTKLYEDYAITYDWYKTGEKCKLTLHDFINESLDGLSENIKIINSNIKKILDYSYKSQNEYLEELQDETILEIDNEIGYHEGQQWYLFSSHAYNEKQFKNIIVDDFSKPKTKKDKFEFEEAQLILNQSYHYAKYELLKTANLFNLKEINIPSTYQLELKTIKQNKIKKAEEEYLNCIQKLQNFYVKNNKKWEVYNPLEQNDET
ncbi:hypothetical protein [Mesomycoplasma neurolyticum]|uniref:Uncharacterized protein n=1 Tax=Mesomycoplasma neurolyticum TaxID=2120 RepID=A0A449A537_9BACT|nr:hypothetical protein [Mesomycoplasma neurolyticum]VEU59332.1 Uncharacterised protein [Mesomycoplasma neurolyticum]